MVKKIAIILVFFLLVPIISSIPASATVFVPFRDIAARSAILVEKDTGTILYEHNIHLRHPADALAKVMTLLLAAYAVENDIIRDNEFITMTESAWHDLNEHSTTQDIQPGEVMTFIDLIYCSFVGNANEASNMIALRVAGSIDAFVRMMNERAAEIGAENTRFVNPHGQYTEAQYTTAYDQFLIFREAMNSSLFSEVSGTFRHTTEGSYDDDVEPRTMTTSNSLINPNSRYYYRNSISGRNTRSFEGGLSLIAYAHEDGLSLISVILGSNEQVFEDGSVELRNFYETLRLLSWGYEQFAWRDVLKTTDLLARIPVMHGAGADFVNARPDDSLTLLLNNAVPNEAFTKTVTVFSDEYEDPLIAPVSAGDILGEVVVTRDGVEYARMNLVANTDIALNGFEFMRRQVMAMLSSNIAHGIFIVLIALLVVYIALVVRYNIVRANRLRRIREAKSEIIRDRHDNYRD